jgi:hypothetical protein
MSEFIPVDNEPQVAAMPRELQSPEEVLGSLRLVFILAVSIVLITFFTGFFYMMGHIK